MIHPARTFPFDVLAQELEARVASGALARADDGPLRLYIYSNRCVYDRLWDDISELARGLVLDREAKVVRATPFPKFFNYGETGVALPDEPFEVYDDPAFRRAVLKDIRPVGNVLPGYAPSKYILGAMDEG